MGDLDPIYYMIPILGPIQAHNRSGISPQSRPIPILYNGPPLPPHNCLFLW